MCPDRGVSRGAPPAATAAIVSAGLLCRRGAAACGAGVELVDGEAGAITGLRAAPWRAPKAGRRGTAAH
jgi:hypothetical protein